MMRPTITRANRARQEQGSALFYTIIAVVLGIITYFEFAIVEYQSGVFAFLPEGPTLFWLYALSIVKFVLVVAFFMHLAGDHSLLSGLFSSGLLMGAATVAIVLILFTVPNMNKFMSEIRTQQEQAAAHGGGHGSGHGSGHAEEVEVPAVSYEQSLARPLPKRQQMVSYQPDDAELELPTIDLTSALAQASEGKEAEAGEELSEEEQAYEDNRAVLEEDAPIFVWQALGQGTYETNCIACHQIDGAGVPGAFPPLKGHISKFYSAEGGREYLANVVLYGLQGSVEIEGIPYNGFMTPHNFLTDDQLAAVLNYSIFVISREGEIAKIVEEEGLEALKPILPQEIAEQRQAPKQPAEVLALRPEL